MKSLLVLNFIIPGMMLLCSWLLKKMKTPYPGPARNQVKWKVDFSGYNTPRSRKSQAHWDYAQTIAPSIFFRHAIAAMAVAVLCSAIGLLVAVIAQLPLWCLGFIFMGRAFRQVESALKARFGE